MGLLRNGATVLVGEAGHRGFVPDQPARDSGVQSVDRALSNLGVYLKHL